MNMKMLPGLVALSSVFAMSHGAVAESMGADGAAPEGVINQAEEKDCDSLKDLYSLSYWKDPAMLVTCVLGEDATAAGEGPDGLTLAFDPNYGRGDSGSFDPQASAAGGGAGGGSTGGGSTGGGSTGGGSTGGGSTGGGSTGGGSAGGGGSIPDGGDPGVDPEPEPEPELVRHIEMPSESGFVGYFAAYNVNTTSSTPAETDAAAQLAGTTETRDMTAGNIGTVTLQLVENAEGEDKVVFHTFDENGDAYVSLNVTGTSSTGAGVPGDPLIESSVDVVDRDPLPDHLNADYSESYTHKNTSGEQGVELFGKNPVIGEADERVVLNDFWAGYFDSYSDQTVTTRDGTDTTSTGSEGTYVVGELTPLADIQSLIADNIQATYSGYSSNAEQLVNLAVDFGTESFTAEVSDITNDNFRVLAGISASTDMSFNASGGIVGTELVSTVVSTATGGAISGYMQGSFSGSQAADVLGVYDITKGTTRVVDTFIADQTGVVQAANRR